MIVPSCMDCLRKFNAALALLYVSESIKTILALLVQIELKESSKKPLTNVNFDSSTNFSILCFVFL